MSADYSRPSGYARRGWIWPAFIILGGIPNWIVVVANPTTIGICAGLFNAAMAIFCYALWRQSVRDDRKHRALMVQLDTRIARLRGLR